MRSDVKPCPNALCRSKHHTQVSPGIIICSACGLQEHVNKWQAARTPDPRVSRLVEALRWIVNNIGDDLDGLDANDMTDALWDVKSRADTALSEWEGEQ